MDYSITDLELKIVCDQELMISKNKVIQTVIKMFSKLSEEFQIIVKENGLENLMEKSAKISKGENYLGLPYVMLDYPREFGKEDVFAIRTFFWWGNYCSTTLFLSGKYFQIFQQAIQLSIQKNQFENWNIQLNPNPWMHHMENGSHKEINHEFDLAGINTSFIKITKKIPLQEWDKLFDGLKNNFSFLVGVLKN